MLPQLMRNIRRAERPTSPRLRRDLAEAGSPGNAAVFFGPSAAMRSCEVACRPPNYVVAETGARQGGTQFPLAAKMGCCQSGPSQAAVGPQRR